MIEQCTLEIKRGDSVSYTLFFRDEDGVIIDITGYEIRFTVKEKITDTDATALTNGISKTITTHTNPSNGETAISLTPTDTNLIGSFVFDIQVKDVSGNITTILEGIINFSKDVTQTS